MTSPPATAAPARAAEPAFLDLPPLRPALIGGLRLLGETVVVPTALFAVLDPRDGLIPALLASLGWCWLAVAVRWWRGRGTPGTLLLSTAMYTARTALALATASAFVYLAQPALGSLIMALLFIGTCVGARPLALRLAHDFIHLPQHLIDRMSVQRMFRQVSLIWGTSRLVAGGLSLLAVLHSTSAGLLARGVGVPVLTVATVGLCAWWGYRKLSADNIRLRLAPRHAATAATAA